MQKRQPKVADSAQFFCEISEPRFTGHSMGGAVAQLLGVYWDWAVTKPKAKMQVVSFGSPPTMSAINA